MRQSQDRRRCGRYPIRGLWLRTMGLGESVIQITLVKKKKRALLVIQCPLTICLQLHSGHVVAEANPHSSSLRLKWEGVLYAAIPSLAQLAKSSYCQWLCESEKDG